MAVPGESQVSTRPKAAVKHFAPSALLRCQEFLVALVMGCTGQLPNHHRTLPWQSRVTIIRQQQGIIDTRQKKKKKGISDIHQQNSEEKLSKTCLLLHSKVTLR